MPGLELFNSYEQEFNDLVISIRNALNVDAKNSVGGTPSTSLKNPMKIMVFRNAYLASMSCWSWCIEQRKAILRRVERDYEEAEEIVSLVEWVFGRLQYIFIHRAASHLDPQLSQMDVELQSLDRALKPTISQKLKSFKGELSSFKSQIVELHSHPIHATLNNLSVGMISTDLTSFADLFIYTHKW